MIHHHSRNALLILALSTTAVVCALYVYVFRAIEISAKSALTAREAVRYEEFSKNQRKNITAVHESTIHDRSRLGSLFVSDDQTVAFIEMLESLGQNTGATVALTSIDATDLQGSLANSLGRVNAHVDISGSWSSVMRTLILAEILPYKSSINSVNLESSGTAGDKDPKTLWHASFNLTAATIHRTQ